MQDVTNEVALSFLSNAATTLRAAMRLEEAGDELITLHKLNLPATLNLSLLYTNAIKYVMGNYRGHTARVSL